MVMPTMSASAQPFGEPADGIARRKRTGGSALGVWGFCGTLNEHTVVPLAQELRILQCPEDRLAHVMFQSGQAFRVAERELRSRHLEKNRFQLMHRIFHARNTTQQLHASAR